MAYRTLLTAVEKGLDDIKSTILNNAESVDGENNLNLYNRHPAQSDISCHLSEEASVPPAQYDNYSDNP